MSATVPPSPGTLPSDLREPVERAAVRLGVFGHRILWYPEIGSTNDAALALAESGAPEGCVVVAEAQTAGRGRLGRTWVSLPGAGLYVSIVLRPEPPVAPLVSLTAGLAVAEGIEAATGLPVSVKWPNDVYVASRKLAGILAESSAPSIVALGFGVNVMPAAYPAEVASLATSIECELGRPVDRGVVFAECLAALHTRYRDLQSSQVAGLLTAWRARASSTFGRRVEWEAGGSIQQGVAHDIDDDGALLVRAGGSVVRVISGEVRWI